MADDLSPAHIAFNANQVRKTHRIDDLLRETQELFNKTRETPKESLNFIKALELLMELVEIVRYHEIVSNK